MKRGGWIAALTVACMALAAPALAQNMSLRGPAWAQPLLASDIIPTTGGRAALNEAGIDVAARVTLAPYQGGVARVIRYEQRGGEAILALRRFTGHPNTGWWIWGPETPTISTPNAAAREEIVGLVRAAIGLGASMGGDPNASCPAGEQAFVELALGTRTTTATRVCITGTDAVGRLVTRLSTLAGSRNQEELFAAALEEIMEADRAFNAMAQSEGVGAAFVEFAAEDAIMFNGAEPIQGKEAVRAQFANWPEGARLEWAPVTGQVSERGDLAWTWGRATYTAPDGTRTQSRYVTTWKRNWDGQWRFSFDAQLGGG